MIKNVLVPFDFSDESYYGLSFAIKLASKFHGKVHLGYFVAPAVWHIPVKSQEALLGNMSAVQHALMKDEDQQIHKKLGHVMKEQVPVNLRGDVYTEATSDYRSVEVFCQDRDVDIIVVGTSGERSFWELFTGNNTESIIRKSPIPVLALSSTKELRMHNILVVTDLGETVPTRLLALCKLFQEEGARIHLLNIIESELITVKEVRNKMVDYVSKHELERAKIHIKAGNDLISPLGEALDDISPDMVLMKTYSKHPFWSFLEGSLAEKVIREFEVPTLVERV